MKYDHLTLERLKEMLSYDRETGLWTWLQRPYANSRGRIGDVAGTKKGNGYLYIGIDSRTYLGSQLAWFYEHGVWAAGTVRVINGDPSDIRIDNLVESKNYRKANPGVQRSHSFRKFYGIDLADYQRMFVEQGGVCAICRQPETAKSRWNPAGEAKWLSVDHDHTTKVVRGLLCTGCNSVLGHSRDDANVLRAAAGYLDRHDTKAEPLKESA